MENAIELKHITKIFAGKVTANDDISMELHKGEILALLGENGSGKTTLMNMLSGIYRPDIGEIYVDGKPVDIRSPKDALAYMQENSVYLAFLDIQMPGMLGTELAKRIKLLHPTIHIVFTTGYDSYMGDAFSLHANGYILKPVTNAKIEK